MIYVIGHKSPDLDSVVSAISYANLKNKLAETNIYVSACAGDVNKETAYILKKFDFETPEDPLNLSEKEVVLVDHNETSQMLDGGENAEIIEILDHHKINFNSEKPIEFRVIPWGSTATIIAREYFEKEVFLDKSMASILLAAVLSDTVITKSPTCTDIDKEIIKKLSEVSEIADWHEFGMEIFKVGSSITDLSAEEIVVYDFKDFEYKKGKFGIGQIQTVDSTEFIKREDEFLKALKKKMDEEEYHSIILFITDIIKEGSQFLIVSKELEKIEEAFEKKIKDGRVYMDGVISRKKQVLPSLSAVFDR